MTRSPLFRLALPLLSLACGDKEEDQDDYTAECIEMCPTYADYCGASESGCEAACEEDFSHAGCMRAFEGFVEEYESGEDDDLTSECGVTAECLTE